MSELTPSELDALDAVLEVVRASVTTGLDPFMEDRAAAFVAALAAVDPPLTVVPLAAAPPLPASGALDVERLADAIHRNHNALACRHLEDRTDAQRIAAAYAAEGRPSDGR